MRNIYGSGIINLPTSGSIFALFKSETRVLMESLVPFYKISPRSNDKLPYHINIRKERHERTKETLRREVGS